MSFETGDYVVFTEEKIEGMLKAISINKSNNYLYNFQSKIIDGERKSMYIVKCVHGKMFNAYLKGELHYGLNPGEFRLATQKEKIEHNLKKIYND
jgi:hypothetical protein